MAALAAETGVTTTITIEEEAAAVVETITATEEVEIWVEVTTMEVIMEVADMAGAIIIITDTTHKATTMVMVVVTTEVEAEGTIHANEIIETIGMVAGEAMTTRAPAIIINTTITTTTIISGCTHMITIRCTGATSTVISNSKWEGL